MATLKDLFSVSRFYDLTFFTDHSVDNLSGHVESIEISETPDIDLFIPEKIILLTTAMIFKDKQKDMPEYLDRLKAAKVAALGIKTGRFLGKLDQSVIDHGNKIDLPIFYIPDHYSLGSLLHQFSNLLWEDERNKILYAFDVQRNFAELLYKGADIIEILDLLSKNINSPVVLLNHFLDLRATSSNFSQAGISEKELVANIILEREKTKKSFGTFLLHLPDGRKQSIHISKVSSNDYFPNYLVILNSDTLNYPVVKFIVSQTVLVLKFTLFKEKQIFTHNQTKKQDMFYEMLRYIEEDALPNRNWLKDNRKEFLNISNYYQVILVQIDINNLVHKTARYLDELNQNIDEWLAIHLENYLSNTIYFKDNSKDMFIIFIQDRQGGIEK
ncbi:MAG: hypothetical protein GX326_03915, partial [Clostridiaceae bacterium]|nr:hypothetical protein [Clostridiaceae bacterium]